MSLAARGDVACDVPVDPGAVPEHRGRHRQEGAAMSPAMPLHVANDIAGDVGCTLANIAYDGTCANKKTGSS